MDPEVRALLESADHPTETEWGPGHDYRASLARVKALWPELERIAGRSFSLDDQVQDATYFAELAIYRLMEEPNRYEAVISLCFSRASSP